MSASAEYNGLSQVGGLSEGDIFKADNVLRLPSTSEFHPLWVIVSKMSDGSAYVAPIKEKGKVQLCDRVLICIYDNTEGYVDIDDSVAFSKIYWVSLIGKISQGTLCKAQGMLEKYLSLPYDG